jgi:ABC-2 type transport system ATP-binding protein
MPIKVAVRNLSKAYDGVAAVSGVGFEVRAGEIFGLLGPNGAGKTTTVESVIGLIGADSGAVEICGIDARRKPREARQKIGVALQSTGLQDKITPREALAAFGAFYRAPADPKALLDRFGLTSKADAAFDTLSGGQKQRVALALAFVNNPEVVFLDEPTASLDPQMRRELHGHIREMRQEGRSVLLTTHDMDEAEQLCDRIAVIDGGRIVAEGSPRELIAGSQSAVSISLQTSAPLEPNWLAHLPHVGEIVCDGDGARFTTTDVNRALAELTAALDARQIQIAGLRAGKATLEDVILELTGSSPRE